MNKEKMFKEIAEMMAEETNIETIYTSIKCIYQSGFSEGMLKANEVASKIFETARVK